MLKSQRYATLMSARHPLAVIGVSLDAYLRADHVVVTGDSGRPNLQAALRRLGADVNAPASVNHFASLPPLLSARSDLIATVPDTITSVTSPYCGAAPRSSIPPPFDRDRPVVVRLIRCAAPGHG